MMTSERLVQLMTASAERTLHTRIVQMLLAGLGLQPHSYDLAVPLGTDARATNADAVAHWIEYSYESYVEATPREMLIRLREELAHAEHDCWEGV